MANVLVLCAGNSCRSQMAQAYLQAYLPKGNQVFSAGVDPKPLNPLTIQVMAEDGIDISNSTSNHIDELEQLKFAWMLTVCENAQEKCPIWVRFGKVLNQHYKDPSLATGNKDEQLKVFRETRDAIKAFCKEIAVNPDLAPSLFDEHRLKVQSMISNELKNNGKNRLSKYFASWFLSRPSRFA